MNIIDTRDLYKRQCELQEELETLEIEIYDAQEEYDNALDDGSEKGWDADDYAMLEDQVNTARQALADWKEENQEELEELNALESEVGGEWMHGAALIAEDDFQEYAQDLAEDIGAIDHNASWPLTCIDWEQAADELKQDYSTVEYQGTTYLFGD